MFDLFSHEYEPTWRERLVLAALFAVAGALAAIAASALPVVELRLRNIWQAALAALTASLVLSRHFLIASHRATRLVTTGLSLLLCLLGYLAFAVWLHLLPSPTSFEGSTEAPWQLSAFLSYAIFLLTWPVYLPAAILAGHVVPPLARRVSRSVRNDPSRPFRPVES